MEEKLPKRKPTRLSNHDYGAASAYFITICTQERRRILSTVVGADVPDGPSGDRTYGVALFEKGKIAERILRQMSDFYEKISVDAYVMMPDHIHFLLQIQATCEGEGYGGGPSGTPVPTQNSTLSRFVSSFKRCCNKEYGKDIWQRRFYDHITRDREDYERHLRYILENPARRYLADNAEKIPQNEM